MILCPRRLSIRTSLLNFEGMNDVTVGVGKLLSMRLEAIFGRAMHRSGARWSFQHGLRDNCTTGLEHKTITTERKDLITVVATTECDVPAFVEKLIHTGNININSRRKIRIAWTLPEVVVGRQHALAER